MLAAGWSGAAPAGSRSLTDGVRSFAARGITRAFIPLAGPSVPGRLAGMAAAAAVPGYFGRHRLALVSRKGFVSPWATISHHALEMGAHVFVGDRAVIYHDDRGGPVHLGDGVALNDGVRLQTGSGGTISIGAATHVQPDCQFSAYLGSIRIGNRVEIAPRCAFYPYDHGVALGIPIRDQPLVSKGDIVVGDDAWLGYGVVVLSGVTIGDGAVVGAGSVVTESIPANAIAVGVPARVLRQRPHAGR